MLRRIMLMMMMMRMRMMISNVQTVVVEVNSFVRTMSCNLLLTFELHDFVTCFLTGVIHRRNIQRINCNHD